MRRILQQCFKILSVLIVIGVVFGFGFLSAYHVFIGRHGIPNESIATQRIDPDKLGSIPVEFTPVEIEPANIEAVRLSLERKIYGARRPTSSAKSRLLEFNEFAEKYASSTEPSESYQTIVQERGLEIWEISGAFPELDGYVWRSIALKNPQRDARGLIVFHQGHDGNPFDFRTSNTVIKTLLEQQFDVLILSMPTLGWNKVEDVRVKTWDGWGYLTTSHRNNHALFQMIDTGKGHFIKFFIEPIVASLDEVTGQRAYRKIGMLGHSGGGWSTTIAAALDARIDYSISYAGTLPFFARHKAKDLGDTEQYDNAFYRDFTYPMLYALASGSEERPRVHYQIFNTDDDCCFDRDSWSTLQKFHTARMLHQDLDFRIKTVPSNVHAMRPEVFLDIVRSLEF